MIRALIHIGNGSVDIGRWFRFGGWFPWNEWREQQWLYPHLRRSMWAHGWLHMSIGRWHWHFSWDHLRDRDGVDYDAIP